jgi:hypothetical protein
MGCPPQNKLHRMPKMLIGGETACIVIKKEDPPRMLPPKEKMRIRWLCFTASNEHKVLHTRKMVIRSRYDQQLLKASLKY